MGNVLGGDLWEAHGVGDGDGTGLRVTCPKLPLFSVDSVTLGPWGLRPSCLQKQGTCVRVRGRRPARVRLLDSPGRHGPALLLRGLL